MEKAKKYVLALGFAMITFVLMVELTKWTGWRMELLVGWFPITAWFSTIHLINAKNGVKYKHTSWGTIGFAFILAVVMISCCSLLGMPMEINGALTGLMYNLVTKPELQGEEIEK